MATTYQVLALAQDFATDKQYPKIQYYLSEAISFFDTSVKLSEKIESAPLHIVKKSFESPKLYLQVLQRLEEAKSREVQGSLTFKPYAIGFYELDRAGYLSLASFYFFNALQKAKEHDLLTVDSTPPILLTASVFLQIAQSITKQNAVLAKRCLITSIQLLGCFPPVQVRNQLSLAYNLLSSVSSPTLKSYLQTKATSLPKLLDSSLQAVELQRKLHPGNHQGLAHAHLNAAKYLLEIDSIQPAAVQLSEAQKMLQYLFPNQTNHPFNLEAEIIQSTLLMKKGQSSKAFDILSSTIQKLEKSSTNYPIALFLLTLSALRSQRRRKNFPELFSECSSYFFDNFIKNGDLLMLALKDDYRFHTSISDAPTCLTQSKMIAEASRPYLSYPPLTSLISSKKTLLLKGLQPRTPKNLSCRLSK